MRTENLNFKVFFLMHLIGRGTDKSRGFKPVHSSLTVVNNAYKIDCVLSVFVARTHT